MVVWILFIWVSSRKERIELWEITEILYLKWSDSKIKFPNRNNTHSIIVTWHYQNARDITRLNSEKFQNFSFQPKFAIFERKSQKMITRVNSQIFRIHPIYDFCYFAENGYFCVKLKKIIIGWVREKPRIHLDNHFCVFSPKMTI